MPQDRPALRPLEVQHTSTGKTRGIVLQDRLGISEPTFIPEPLLPIVGRCTGELTLAEIQAAAAAHYGDTLTDDFVAGIVQQLDDRLLLLGQRFDAAVSKTAAEFLAADARPARHAGSAGYPAEPEALREALDALVSAPAPGRRVVDREPVRPLRGLIAPHIDLLRGADGYRAAYGRLLESPPADLYVIFGTGHAGPTAPLSGLRLDWQTPLGTVSTDRRFIDAVHARIGEPAAHDLLLHRQEHSLEFQVLFLQHLHARHFRTTPFRVAGFLCGSLPSESGDPLAEEYGQQLLAAFRAAERQTAGRVCYIAGADLAHIGPFFGDALAVDNERLARLAEVERARLALLTQGEPGSFHAAVQARRNPDRVCSGPAITLCAALAEGTGDLLHYGQARAGDGSQTVSFCAMAFG